MGTLARRATVKDGSRRPRRRGSTRNPHHARYFGCPVIPGGGPPRTVRASHGPFDVRARSAFAGTRRVAPLPRGPLLRQRLRAACHIGLDVLIGRPTRWAAGQLSTGAAVSAGRPAFPRARQRPPTGRSGSRPTTPSTRRPYSIEQRNTPAASGPPCPPRSRKGDHAAATATAHRRRQRRLAAGAAMRALRPTTHRPAPGPTNAAGRRPRPAGRTR